MRILRATDYKTMPWKNGMGSTTEIAIHPANARLDDFEWRVSMAQVASDGPFSLFAGIDRTLLVLEGIGIDLTVADQPAVRIDRETIHSFPGDQPTSARLIDGAILDLNVMSRREASTHDVRRVKFRQSHDFMISVQTIFVVEAGLVDVVFPRAAVRLEKHDAVIVDASSRNLTFNAGEETQLIAVQFR